MVGRRFGVIAAMIGLMLGSTRVLWPWPGGTNTTTLSMPADDVAVPAQELGGAVQHEGRAVAHCDLN